MNQRKTLTARRLNRATLDRQLLLRRKRLDVVEAVGRVGALQAQEAPSPYIALWNRLSGFDPADLDAAFVAREVVKASLMRITLHAVQAKDYPAFYTAMLPTLHASRLNDQRFKETGLSIADADAYVPQLLQFAAQPRTAAECAELLDKPRVWWALRTFAPLLHAPTGEPWSFGRRPSYVAAPIGHRPVDADESARHLVRRYLEAFGPASMQDVAQFVLFPRSRARARDVLQSMSKTLKKLEGPDGVELFDVPGVRLPAEDKPAPPRLMVDVGQRPACVRRPQPDPEYRQLVTRRNGDVLPTLLVDGYVAGVWRLVDGGIEATAFQPLSAQAWDGLAAEARKLAALLVDRDPHVYRRYHHWWKSLPKTDVRRLTA